MSLEQQRARRYERKRNELSRVGPVRCADCGKTDARFLRVIEAEAGSAERRLVCGNCKDRMTNKKNGSEHSDSRRCIICGASDVALQEHHLGGEANCTATVPACPNHHDILNDMQVDQPEVFRSHRDKESGDTVAAILANIADIIEVFAQHIVALLRRLSDWFHENAPTLQLPAFEGGRL